MFYQRFENSDKAPVTCIRRQIIALTFFFLNVSPAFSLPFVVMAIYSHHTYGTELPRSTGG